MKRSLKLYVVILVALLVLPMATCEQSLRKDTVPDNPRPYNDVSAAEWVNNISIGWNLGNTLDTSDLHWLGNNPSVYAMETAWGNPATTKAHITALKNAGFNAIRIPVSWAKCASVKSDYTIRANWMARVSQVVDYAVENDMYIIINTHHDESIFKFHDSEMDRSKRAFQKIWEQIAAHFRNYDEKLIFEGLNEPRTKGTPAEWNGGTAEERINLNVLNQLFVDTVRASGGNNDKRILLIPTYGASSLAVAMEAVIIPADPSNDHNKIIVSIHAYEPYNFALNENASLNTWNKDTLSDTDPITERVDRAYDLFVSKDIPVIMGEFGAVDKNNTAARAAWAEYYVGYAASKNIPCFWWDNGGNFTLLSRKTNRFTHPEIVEALMRGAR
jgi:endoglucanase